MDNMRRLIGGALAALTMVLFTPTAAYAWGEWREEGSSLFDTQAQKFAEATCPKGTMVVGSGGYVEGGNGDVVLTGVVPNDGLDTVSAHAKALPGSVAPWAVVALAICSDRTSSVVRVTGTSLFGSARAECPEETVLWSTGFSVFRSITTAYVSAVEPAPDMSAVTVRGVTASGSAVVAYAICGYVFPNATALSSASTPVAAQGQTTLTVDPAFNGGRVYGAGISAKRPGLFVDGLGMGWIDGQLSWATGRMSWLPGFGGVKSAAARTTSADDDDMTVHATAIGSWYN